MDFSVYIELLRKKFAFRAALYSVQHRQKGVNRSPLLMGNNIGFRVGRPGLAAPPTGEAAAAGGASTRSNGFFFAVPISYSIGWADRLGTQEKALPKRKKKIVLVHHDPIDITHCLPRIC